MKVHNEYEADYLKCRIRLDNAERAIKISTRVTLLLCLAGFAAILIYMVLTLVTIGLTHKIIEAELFIYGSSDFLFSFDFLLLYGSAGALMLLGVLALVNSVARREAVCVVQLFAMPIILAFAVICIAVGREFTVVYVIMAVYSVAMFALQYAMLHAVSELNELKKRDGYPWFNTLMINEKSGRYSNTEWDKMTADEKLLAEREGYFKGR